MGIVGKVMSEGQTVIPKVVLDAMGLIEGSQIEWQVADGKAFFVARELRMVDLAGILGRPPEGAGLKVEEMDEVVAAAVARHVLGEEE